MVKLLHNRDGSASAAQVEPARVLERLFELAVLLTGSMDSGLAERGLTRARAELLWQVGRQPAVTQRELSQALRCTPRNITDLVDALEEGGMVERRPHPTDRRATLVSLTRRGRTELARMQAGYQALAARLLKDLPPQALAAFTDVLEQLLGRLREPVRPY
jgi:DNA-binding MarR family transcriptional regulator